MTLATSIEQLAPDVIVRASAGEREAIDRLLRVMQRPFYNLALRMLSNRSAAEDATQECLLRVITHLSQYRSEAKFATWATRVAVNVLFDYRSGLAREARKVPRAAGQPAVPEAAGLRGFHEGEGSRARFAGH